MAILTDILNKIPSYGTVHDWLGQETVERLLRFAQSNAHRFKDAMVTHKEGDRVDRTRRVSRKLLDLDALESELRGKLEDLLPIMFSKLGNEPCIPGKIEVELVAHGDGAFFGRHIDTVTHLAHKGRSRMISAVYYFHVLPKAFSGGTLRLHSLAASGQQGTFVDIAPDYDTVVFFPSFFPHEVLPVKCASGQFLDSRFAINFWIHVPLREYQRQESTNLRGVT
jgi:SM-20-related protein